MMRQKLQSAYISSPLMLLLMNGGAGVQVGKDHLLF